MGKKGEALTVVDGASGIEVPVEVRRIRRIAHQVLGFFEKRQIEKFTPGFLEGLVPAMKDGSRKSHLGGLALALQSRGYTITSTSPEHFANPKSYAADLMRANSGELVARFASRDPREAIGELLGIDAPDDAKRPAVVVNGGAPMLFLSDDAGRRALMLATVVDPNVMVIDGPHGALEDIV